MSRFLTLVIVLTVAASARAGVDYRRFVRTADFPQVQFTSQIPVLIEVRPGFDPHNVLLPSAYFSVFEFA